MSGRINLLCRRAFLISLCCFIALNAYGQENEESNNPFVFFVPMGYEYIRMDSQSVHSFAVGVGFLSGEQDIPFNEVERRFFVMALYQPFGVGAGIKHDMKSFVLSGNATDFELQQTSIFAVVDISILKIQGGWIFDSDYLIDNESCGSPGRGFYVGVQGMIPLYSKK